MRHNTRRAIPLEVVYTAPERYRAHTFVITADGDGHWYVITDPTGREVARNWGPGSRASARRHAKQTIDAMTAQRDLAAEELAS